MDLSLLKLKFQSPASRYFEIFLTSNVPHGGRSKTIELILPFFTRVLLILFWVLSTAYMYIILRNHIIITINKPK